MPRCTRKGCQKEYEDGANEECIHHSGAPVFHEGLKSWSCCKDINKPVLDFDDFMKLPGCTRAEQHTTEKINVEPVKTTAPPQVAPSASTNADGKEVYGTAASVAAPNTETFTRPSVATSPAPAPVIEEEDDVSVPVKEGTTCRRKGCGVEFASDEENRKGDGPGTVCTYHPMPPIFHEGSKGYLCCKRRVLEFDEFLKIGGCKTGRHVFAPKANDSGEEELVECRIDHYQTVDKVHVSVFAKKVDKEKSKIEFAADRIGIDMLLPGPKRFVKTLDLYGPIDPDASSLQYFGTKVELHLQKADGKSWTLLERTDRDLGNIALTFGVKGRTGTVGGKELVLDDQNKGK